DSNRTRRRLIARRSHLQGLLAPLSPHHDDHRGRAPRRAAPCSRLRRRRRTPPPSRHHHRRRPHLQPGFNSLHHAHRLHLHGPPANLAPRPLRPPPCPHPSPRPLRLIKHSVQNRFSPTNCFLRSLDYTT